MPEIHLHRIHPELRARAKELRHPLTSEEQKIWSRVRNRQLGGFKIRRQVPLGPYIVDFYCTEVHLVIEIDGEIHKFQKAYDLDRSTWLEEQGLTVIRFTNQQVDGNIEEVIKNHSREMPVMISFDSSTDFQAFLSDLSGRRPLKVTSSETPMSARTASHMVVQPNSARTSRLMVRSTDFSKSTMKIKHPG